MPTISDIRALGTEVVLAPRPIYEPLAAPETTRGVLRRFGSHYDLSPNSNLYKFLSAICGESGAGLLKKEMLYPKLQRALESTHFSDLDSLYGNPLGLSRLSTEIYTIDPRNEILTQAQWQDVKIKDAQYRARCLTWMRAIIAGPTLEGIALAAEAATGVECDVFERYRYIENQSSDIPITISDIGTTDSRNEFVIIPRQPTVSQQERRRIMRMVDKLRPVNTIPTVAAGDTVRTVRAIRAVASTSDGFTVKRYVTGRADIIWPDVDTSEGLWVEATEKEAPTFAFMDRQEAITYMSITGATASSYHTGQFNSTQRDLFAHLRLDILPYQSFVGNLAYSKVFAPIQVSMPWTSRDQET